MVGLESRSARNPDHGTAPEVVQEENYFFRLSRYGAALTRLLDEGRLRIVPEGGVRCLEVTGSFEVDAVNAAAATGGITVSAFREAVGDAALPLGELGAAQLLAQDGQALRAVRRAGVLHHVDVRDSRARGLPPASRWRAYPWRCAAR